MDKMVAEYKVLSSTDLSQLVQHVNEYIQEGWQPLGGVCLSKNESDDFCYDAWAQAMVMYVTRVGLTPVVAVYDFKKEERP